MANRDNRKRLRKQTGPVEDTARIVAAFPCFMCGRTPAGGAGAWLPDNPADKFIIGTPPGKLRIVVYALCPTCRTQPGVLERVEQRVRLERLASC